MRGRYVLILALDRHRAGKIRQKRGQKDGDFYNNDTTILFHGQRCCCNGRFKTNIQHHPHSHTTKPRRIRIPQPHRRAVLYPEPHPTSHPNRTPHDKDGNHPPSSNNSPPQHWLTPPVPQLSLAHLTHILHILIRFLHHLLHEINGLWGRKSAMHHYLFITRRERARGEGICFCFFFFSVVVLIPCHAMPCHVMPSPPSILGREGISYWLFTLGGVGGFVGPSWWDTGKENRGERLFDFDYSQDMPCVVPPIIPTYLVVPGRLWRSFGIMERRWGWSLSNRPGTAPKKGGQAGISSVPIDAWEYTKVPTRAACLLLLLLPMSVYV